MKFFILLKKEIKELLTPQMLAPLLIVIVVFVFIGKVVGKEQEKMIAANNIAVLDQDNSPESARVLEIFKQQKFNIASYGGNPEEALTLAKNQNQKALLIIPSGFGDGIHNFKPQNITVYTILKNFSLSGTRISAPVQSTLALVNESFSNDLLAKAAPGTNTAEIKNPIRPADTTVVGDRQANMNPSAITGFIVSQTTFIPIVLFLVIIFASQLIVTSIATEKENKTLETLLSAPVSRNAIVSAKLIAAGVIALLTSGVYLFGMRYYMNGITGGAAIGSSETVKLAASQLGLVLTTSDYLFLGASLFLGILVALSIALILGAFAEDVKSAQGIISPLMIMILIPYFLTMFLDVSTLSPLLKWILFAIPFSHPFLAAGNLMLGNFYPVIYGILYMLVVFAVFVILASKIFAHDKILTMRLSFGKKKR
ncbi:MAG: ABC transporter permease [Patescibacteria group bacterium]